MQKCELCSTSRSFGSIAPIACIDVAAVTANQPTTIPDRARVQIPHATHYSTRQPSLQQSMVRAYACPKCDMFTKSGRASCCAPGDAWYDKCGGAGNDHVEHTWMEGVKACRRKQVQGYLHADICCSVSAIASRRLLLWLILICCSRDDGC